MKYLLLVIITFTNITMASDSKPCRYMNINEAELVQENICIDFKLWIKRPNDSDALITKQVAVTAQYNKASLAYLYSEHGIFYFMKSGKARKTVSYDNGPDYFNEGFARTLWDRKIGFMNKKLETIISPQYDFAFPFENGLSLVCNGCVSKKDGEYSRVVNGKWGYINKSGKVIIPVNHTKIA